MATLKVKGILSFPHLFQPRAVKAGDDPKYSVSVLVAKNDPQAASILAAVEQEKANGFPSGFPPNGKCFLRDGADPKSDGSPSPAAQHDYWVLVLSSGAEHKPPVVDMSMKPIIDPAQVYAGAEAWVVVNTSVYNIPTNKGVGGYVNGVMLTGNEGALGRLDGRPSAEDMFGELATGQTAAPAVPAAAPPVPAPAVAPPVPAPAAEVHQMLPAAQGATYEAMIGAGWTDETLVQHGMMAPLTSF